MKGLIFSVKRYSVHDGPGIRVTFFMKGCPLACWWCHNPEGISPEKQTIVQTKKMGEKEFSEDEEVGRYITVDDILEILGRESVFFQQSGGGVTFSGGEPMLQPEFLIEALKACKSAGYHTAVDTSGYSSKKNYLDILPFTDLFLFDIKHIDPDKHIEYTGVSNAGIIENFRMLMKSRRDVMLRIPVIPGINDDPIHLSELKRFIIESAGESLKKINLLPFHRIGESKYRKFGMSYRMKDTKPPSPERMKELKDFFSETGIKMKIGG
jgi:pyruvate formate lyase activating enzyme